MVRAFCFLLALAVSATPATAWVNQTPIHPRRANHGIEQLEAGRPPLYAYAQVRNLANNAAGMRHGVFDLVADFERGKFLHVHFANSQMIAVHTARVDNSAAANFQFMSEAPQVQTAMINEERTEQRPEGQASEQNAVQRAFKHLGHDAVPFLCSESAALAARKWPIVSNVARDVSNP